MNTISHNSSSSPINALRHLTLSIDKGITDDANQQIIKITDILQMQWQHDKVLSVFIKMVRALSDYAASRKSDIHEDTASLMHSIVNQMANLSSSPGKELPIARKQAILSEEIAKYNDLKQQIKSTPREDSSREDSSNAAYRSDMESNIISDLKGIILSLDWEITDEIIQRLDIEAQRLQRHWAKSKIHLSFLQMFKSIGSYVLSKGSNTHPDSISLLHSLYRNFEHIVMSPSMTMADQKEILLREMKKFNDLKKTIASENRPKERPALSPMDDLIGTKVSNLSPVDDLIEEIHMLQDSGTRTHSLDASTVSHGHTASSEIKEVIPKRLKNQPIPEIQARLDAFFDEDESLSELSFADSGEEVVPYRGDPGSSESPSSDLKLTLTDDYKSEDREEGLTFEDELVSDLDGISFEDDSSAPEQSEITFKDDTQAGDKFKSTIDQQAIESSSLATDDLVPYNFKDEFFDEESDDTLHSKDSQKKQATKMQEAVEKQMSADIQIAEEDLNIAEDDAQIEVDVQTTRDGELTAEMVLLEDLKSTVAKCMFHGGAKELQTINEHITALEDLWKKEPEKLILLKMVKSLIVYLDLPSSEPEAQTLDLMLHIVESMENIGLKSSGVKNGEKFQKSGLIDLFSKYIDFQSTMVDRISFKITSLKGSSEREDILKYRTPEEHMTLSEKTLTSEKNYSRTDSYSDLFNQPETLADKEIFYERPSEDTSEIEKRLTEQKGLWSKIRRFLRF